MSKVYLASDHAGYALKAALVLFLQELGHEVEDLGAHALNAGDDYPDFVTPCAVRVAGEPGAFGIILGGSGQGEAMAANRVKGVRAAVFYGEAESPQVDANGEALEVIPSVRAHNNANILSLGARFVGERQAKIAVKEFLETPFSGDERHVRRLAKF